MLGGTTILIQLVDKRARGTHFAHDKVDLLSLDTDNHGFCSSVSVKSFIVGNTCATYRVEGRSRLFSSVPRLVCSRIYPSPAVSASLLLSSFLGQ